ncbi:MAG: DUF308 domain-containing protein [Planctomycetes bacterium]|nr:DUF308 domain-containing protein [Planctomycetota bacterium]MCH9723812.1 DUF308 domain-containing protein [Planctomycetota bacterium]MCH9776283.1 DUF308 domain-containing protein [Planctomycetota bacterium]MCH9790481.1 DUF308 domain-containing protein [Planctomycetota bacterium]MDF1744347.1 DUF308 domain-containing protein [Gimesia sp.]
MTDATLPAPKDFKLIGIILCIIGVICLIAPFGPGIAVVYIAGFSLLFGGVLYAVQGTRVGDVPGKAQHLILGILMVLGGLGVISHPLFGLSFLTLLMAMFFIFEGVWKIVMALGAQPDSGRNSILFSGVISLLLGGLIWGQWPLSGVWAVGTLMGVDFLLTGFFLLNLGNAVASSEPETIETTTAEN